MALAACNLPSAFAFHNRIAAPYNFQQNGSFGCVQSCLSQYANKGALGHSSTAIHFVCKAHNASTRVAQRRVTVIPQSCQTFLASSCEAASKGKQLAKKVPRKQGVLQSSFLGKQSTSYAELSSSVLVSHAAWAIFGLYPASGSTFTHRATRNCRTPVILAGRGPARGATWFIGILTGVFVAAMLAISSFIIVPSGSVGVRTTFSQVERQVLQPGVYFINPLVSSIQNFTTKTQLIVADESDVPTKEGLVVELDVSILHSLEPAKAADLFVTVGPDYVNKIILPELHSAVANITSENSARALYTDARAQLTRELTSYLQQKLSHKGIVIEDVLLRAIKLPEQLTNAIQDKLRTEQEAQRMEFVLLKEQQEAERKMIEAKGIATFQKIVSQGISPQLLQWKGIEATQELAKSQNSKMVLIGNAANGLPIILGGADNKKR